MISNRLLAALALALVVITLTTQYTLLHSYPGIAITGLASTDAGQVTLTLQTTGSVRFAVSSINFGTGKVNTSNGNTQCILDTNGTNSSTQCINFTASFGNFTLENDGSTNVSVQLAFSANESFLGGTTSLAKYRYTVMLNETNACKNGTGGNSQAAIDAPSGNCTQITGAGGNCTVNPTSWTNVNITGSGTTICGMLMPEEANDSIAIDINFTIPYDAPSGLKTSVLTATASSN